MKEPISDPTKAPDPTAADALESELGKMLRDRKALAAGRCSIAHAEYLMRLRESKLYRNRCATWEEFCPRYLGLSKAFANRVIRALQDFGPAYFELAELIRITPDEFRAVAPLVKNGALRVGRETIALLPENADRIAIAVERLRRSTYEPHRAPSRSTVLNRLKLLERQSVELTNEFRKLAGPMAPDVDRLQLASVLRQTLGMLGRIELEMGIF